MGTLPLDCLIFLITLAFNVARGLFQRSHSFRVLAMLLYWPSFNITGLVTSPNSDMDPEKTHIKRTKVIFQKLIFSAPHSILPCGQIPEQSLARFSPRHRRM